MFYLPVELADPEMGQPFYILVTVVTSRALTEHIPLEQLLHGRI